MRVEQVGEFSVRTEDGEVVRVVEYQQYIPTGSRGDPHAEILGEKSLRTGAGHPVNVRGDEFEILDPWGPKKARRC